MGLGAQAGELVDLFAGTGGFSLGLLRPKQHQDVAASSQNFTMSAGMMI
jgi:tRNA G37 N-methylase Trm5